jgi:TonB family protein
MKKIFSFIIAFFAMILLLSGSYLYAQCDKDSHKTCKQGIAIVRSEDGNPTPPSAAWKLPHYIGGTKGMCNYFCENMQYPKALKAQKIKGVVTVEFMVRADGSVTDVAIVETSGYEDFDNEAIRLVNSFPKWKAAEIECQPTEMKSQVDVIFDLDKCDPDKKRAELKEQAMIAEKMGKMMPITLYFDNDRPDPNSKETITVKSYSLAYQDYFALKDTYKAKYSKGLTDQKKTDAEAEMEQFFNGSVKAEYDKLVEFTDLLLKVLKTGKTITLNVAGFASPLSDNDYNAKISSRRISSFRNYLNDFGGGVLTSYIYNGQLTINENPQGESISAGSVSDNFNDQKNSVYSVAAAKERKIQITIIQ